MLSRLKSARLLTVPAATWLAWVLPVFAWAPLTYPGYFQFQSGFAPVFNLNDLARRVLDLAWAPEAGQAYDLWRGERALPYALALLPKALGLSGVTAIKLVFAAAILAGALGTFMWARRRLGEWPALLAAAVYAFWPLALDTIYVRGALAEAVLLGLAPLAWWAFDAASTDGRPWAAAAGGLCLAAALWTQAGLAFWLALVLLLAILVVGGRRRARLCGWLGGLALGALGLLPLVLRRGLGGGPTWPAFFSGLIYPHQLLLAGPGSQSGLAGGDTVWTYQLGLVACGLALMGLVVPAGALRERASDDLDRRARFAAGVVLVLAFLSTTLAAPLWQLVPFLGRTLTYPWQLLLLAGPGLAWLAGRGSRALLDLWPATRQAQGTVPLFAALLGLALLGSYADLNPPSTSLPVGAAPVAVFGDHEIALLDATAYGLPQAGGQITVTVHWQALRPLSQDYSVFLHAVGPNDTLWGQQDTMPQDGKLPTTQWQPGQIIADRYHLTLKPGAPTGGYQYQLGLYLWQTGQRLSTGTDNKVVLDRLAGPKEPMTQTTGSP